MRTHTDFSPVRLYFPSPQGSQAETSTGCLLGFEGAGPKAEHTHPLPASRQQRRLAKPVEKALGPL